MVPAKRRRRGARARRARRLAVLAGALFTAAISVGLMLKTVPPVGSAAAVHLPELPPAPPALAPESVAFTQRPVFPYSVINGGAVSVEELKAAIDKDPVVAEHYAGFDVGRARVERLEVPQLAYVSYRIGSDVFWTRRPVLVPAGETVLTDGQRVARTRCGNQLASQPGAVADLEPPPSVLDTPVLTLLPRTYGSFRIPVPPVLDIGVFAPPIGPGFISSVPGGESGPWIGPTSTTGLTPDVDAGTPLWPDDPDSPVGDLPSPPSPESLPYPNPVIDPLPPFDPELPPTVPLPPAPVPEPATLLLTLTGITAYGARRIRARRRRSEPQPIID
jgi:hypothetical protein